MRLLHDAELLGETVGAIYDCVPEPERWQPLLIRLADLIGARTAFLGISGMRHIDGFHAVHGLPPTEEFLRHAPVNPFMPLLSLMPPDRTYVVSRDYGLEALRATRFHRDYLARHGFADLLAFVPVAEGEVFAQVAVITHDDREPFTAEEIAGYDLLAPHIRRALEIANVLGLQRMEAETYRSALDRLDSPVLILDGGRRVTHANARAGREVEAGKLFRILDGTLRGATHAAEAALRRVVREGASGFEAALTDAGGQERLIFAVGFDVHGAQASDRAVMLVWRNPREDTRNPIAITARAFALTPAQAQVLAFLAGGNAPEDIADILGVSVSTVRTHLAGLFGKTGTSRQAELVARALSLASPIRMDTPIRLDTLEG